MRRVAVRAATTFVAAAGLAAIAAAETSNVLVLYSNGRLMPFNVQGDRGLHQTVRAPAGRPLALFSEFLDAPRIVGEAHNRLVAAYLREKYASRPPRVIVAVREEALGFLLRHRARLFPRVPVVHVGVDTRALRSMSLPADVVGVPLRRDFAPTIDLALRWHPRARRLVVVTGTSEPDQRFRGPGPERGPSVRGPRDGVVPRRSSARRAAPAPGRGGRRRRRLHARLVPGRRGPGPHRLRDRPRPWPPPPGPRSMDPPPPSSAPGSWAAILRASKTWGARSDEPSTSFSRAPRPARCGLSRWCRRG